MPLRANKEKSLHKNTYFQDACQVPNKIKKDTAKQKNRILLSTPTCGKNNVLYCLKIYINPIFNYKNPKNNIYCSLIPIEMDTILKNVLK